MDEKLKINDTEKDYSYSNSEESDYENLINRLREIQKTISLLDKTKL